MRTAIVGAGLQGYPLESHHRGFGPALKQEPLPLLLLRLPLPGRPLQGRGQRGLPARYPGSLRGYFPPGQSIHRQPRFYGHRAAPLSS